MSKRRRDSKVSVQYCRFNNEMFIVIIEYDTVSIFVSHARGNTTFMVYSFFRTLSSSHLFVFLLLMKLKLQWKSLSLYFDKVSMDEASQQGNERRWRTHVISVWHHGNLQPNQNHLPFWFNIIIVDSYLHFTHTKFLFTSIWCVPKTPRIVFTRRNLPGESIA